MPYTPPLQLLLLITITIITISSTASSSSPKLKWTTKTPPRFLTNKFAAYPIFIKPKLNTQIRYETRYFDQRLDHFSFANLPKFKQRYLIDTHHWSGADRMGPIFFYCGNEGDIEWFALNTGFVWEIAPKFGAMVVFPEVCLVFLLSIAISML